MRALILALVMVWAPLVATADTNYKEGVKDCLKHFGYNWDAPVRERIDNFDWNAASLCTNEVKRKIVAEKHAELQDFLKHNPRYRVPGQSLNRCWGKPREMPFESSYIRVDKNGLEAGVNYKDTLPAGCYENAPWDNREANK